MQKTITIKTEYKRQAINITDRVMEVVQETSDNYKMMNVFVMHSTAGIIINEDEEMLKQDFLSVFEKTFLTELKHDTIDNNAKAHIFSSAIGQSINVPLENGRLALGTWQQLLLIEFDGPRERKIKITLY